MKTILAIGLLLSTYCLADEAKNAEIKPTEITIKGDPSMPVGVMGYVQFGTVEGHVLHIGPGGICLYEQGKWQRWCK